MDEEIKQSIREHNAWVEELKEDITFEPLLDFLDQLKEPLPGTVAER